MEDAYWERCPYYAEDKCPHSSPVDRAYLIPHLLSAAEINEAKGICRQCGFYLSEKRKHFRLRKPFKVVLMPSSGKTKFNGKIVNVSGFGALVTFEDLPDLVLNQEVKIEIYSRQKTSKESDEIVIKVTGEIKRISDKDKQIAIMFLKEVRQEYLLAL